MYRKVQSLKLSNKAIADREEVQKKNGVFPKANPLVMGLYQILCFALDVIYRNRPIQRFWVLETVARMPYFSYISILHLYESLGWFRAGAELRKVHFAEEWNELHHLHVMEALGGDRLWIDRFIGYHSAVVYYWVLLIMYAIAPAQSYGFSELIETHAVATYGEFVDANEEVLKSLPAPLAAVAYYRGSDVYMFETFMTANTTATRRPKCNNLYDTFVNIRDDENEHVKTMNACGNAMIQAQLETKAKNRSG